jgi:hypothetical protein
MRKRASRAMSAAVVVNCIAGRRYVGTAGASAPSSKCPIARRGSALCVTKWKVLFAIPSGRSRRASRYVSYRSRVTASMIRARRPYPVFE